MNNSPRALLAAIEALPLPGPVRILNLCGDQERVIALSGMRRALPEQVRLLSGPGCAASICPAAELYQAIRLTERHPVTLLVADNMLRLPLGGYVEGPRSLLEARNGGADVRLISAPVEAVLIAQAEPQREMVLFAAGFETLLAPLAGMVLEGLPDNLSLLLCGRRVEPLFEHALVRTDPGFDALLLPGNRCAVTGTLGMGKAGRRTPCACGGRRLYRRQYHGGDPRRAATALRRRGPGREPLPGDGEAGGQRDGARPAVPGVRPRQW